MKKIINGKKYDTETAKCLAEYTSDYARNDFHFYEEELYRKKTGEYFLHGKGGAASSYAEYLNGYNCWTGGEKITPISFERARTWAEKKLNSEDYEKIFGEVTEDESKQAITFTLDEQVIKKLKLYADKSNKKPSEILNDLIQNNL